MRPVTAGHPGLDSRICGLWAVGCGLWARVAPSSTCHEDGRHVAVRRLEPARALCLRSPSHSESRGIASAIIVRRIRRTSYEEKGDLRGRRVTRRLACWLVSAMLLMILATSRAWRSWRRRIRRSSCSVYRVDREFKAEQELVGILVVFSEGNEASVSAKNEVVAALGEVSVRPGWAISRFARRPPRMPRPPGIVDDAIAASKAAGRLRLSGARGRDRPDCTDITRKRSVLSFTGVEPFVRSGVSVYLELVARAGKPAIIVNLASSKAEGAESQSGAPAPRRDPQVGALPTPGRGPTASLCSLPCALDRPARVRLVGEDVQPSRAPACCRWLRPRRGNPAPCRSGKNSTSACSLTR